MTAAKPYPFGLLSQLVTQATGMVLLACEIPRSERTASLLLLCLSSPFGKCLFLFLSFPFLFGGAELTQICHSAAGSVQTLGVLGVQLPGTREFPLGR